MAAYAAWQNGFSPRPTTREIFVEAPLCHPAVLRRAALDAVGGYRDTAWPEDWDLWLRLDAAGFGPARLERVLFRWLHREGRLTFTHARYAWERLMMDDGRGTSRSASRVAAGRAARGVGAGPTGRPWRARSKAAACGPRFFVDIDPRKIGRTARGAPRRKPRALDASEALLRGRRRRARGANPWCATRSPPRGWRAGELPRRVLKFQRRDRARRAMVTEPRTAAVISCRGALTGAPVLGQPPLIPDADLPPEILHLLLLAACARWWPARRAPSPPTATPASRTTSRCRRGHGRPGPVDPPPERCGQAGQRCCGGTACDGLRLSRGRALRAAERRDA